MEPATARDCIMACLYAAGHELRRAQPPLCARHPARTTTVMGCTFCLMLM